VLRPPGRLLGRPVAALGWARRRHCATEVSWAPGGLARIADVVPQQAGFQPKFRRLEVCDGIFTSPAPITDGSIFHSGDVDGSEISRAHSAGHLHRIAAVRLDALPSLWGDQRGGDDPAHVSFFAQIPVEPRAAGPAASTKPRGLAFECSCRMSYSMSACRMPMVLQYMTCAS
jgi:hypothetical protein